MLTSAAIAGAVAAPIAAAARAASPQPTASTNDAVTGFPF